MDLNETFQEEMFEKEMFSRRTETAFWKKILFLKMLSYYLSIVVD
jgi:hypothetical protein